MEFKELRLLGFHDKKNYGIICKVANKKSLCECAKSAQKPKVAGRQSRQESETATNLH